MAETDRGWFGLLRDRDPVHRPRSAKSATSSAPQSFSELLGDPGVVEVSELRSRFGFLAIHGGGLEQMTDIIAERAAEASGAARLGEALLERFAEAVERDRVEAERREPGLFPEPEP